MFSFTGHTGCVAALIAAGADVNTQNKWDETPLSKAAAYNHTECVALLLKHNADVNCVDLWQETPLFKATAKCHINCMKLLLEGMHVFIFGKQQ